MDKCLIFNFILLLTLSRNIVGETYDLENYLSLVETHSKALKLAAMEKDLAQTQKKEALSSALPRIWAQSEYKRNLADYYLYADMSALFPGMGQGISKFKVNRNNEFSVNAALSQTLFSPQVGYAIKAARQYQQLSELIYKASLREILCTSKKLFYQTVLLEKLSSVSQAAEKNAHDNYLNVKMKFENGVVSEFALLQAEVRWKNTIPETARAKRNYEMALNNLKNLAGISIEQEIRLDGDLGNFPLLPQPIPLEQVLNQRPDFNALLWEKQLKATGLQAQKGAYLPTLSGNLVYVFASQSDNWQLEQKNSNYFLGLHLSLPIYTGGYRRAQVEKAQIELEKAEVKIHQTKENIYNELINIKLRLNEAYERILSAEATLKTAEKAFNIAENTAKSGLATQLELKDARIGFDQAQVNYYAAIYDYLEAYFDWEHAVGTRK